MKSLHPERYRAYIVFLKTLNLSRLVVCSIDIYVCQRNGEIQFTIAVSREKNFVTYLEMRNI